VKGFAKRWNKLATSHECSGDHGYHHQKPADKTKGLQVMYTSQSVFVRLIKDMNIGAVLIQKLEHG
jgi:hypothetical protein